MGHLLDALGRAYDVLGFGRATAGDEVFRQLVLARIIEPASKQDTLRVLAEAGRAAASYATLKRRLPAYDTLRGGTSCPRPAPRMPRWARPSLVLYDVSTLYFETEPGTGSASPGSPRNAAWSRRSPSGCSPTPPGSR